MTEPIARVTKAHFTIQDTKWLNQPLVELNLSSTDLIVGCHWFAKHKTMVDCETESLVWKENPPQTPFVKDIIVDLKSPQRIGPSHQTDADA